MTEIKLQAIAQRRQQLEERFKDKRLSRRDQDYVAASLNECIALQMLLSDEISTPQYQAWNYLPEPTTRAKR